MSNSDRFSLPAEWEMEGAVLMAWPHADTDWNYMLPEAIACFRDVVTAISSYYKVILVTPDIESARIQLGPNCRIKPEFIPLKTNDTWARDFGPISVRSENGNWTCLDFRFNGWGLKFASCFDNLICRGLKAVGTISAELADRQDFVLEGGGIESDGSGTLMTTAACQLSPNRNPFLTELEIVDRLQSYFGAPHTIMLRHGYLAGDDTDSHIDTLARFAPDRSIVFTGCQNPEDEHFAELNLMKQELAEATSADGLPFNLFELPLPSPIFDENGQRLPATYANFLVTPRAVFMPTYSQPMNDDLARRIVEVAYNRPVVTVDCRQLIRQHGSLHCITMQLPSQVL